MAPRLSRKEALTSWVLGALLGLIALLATIGLALLLKKGGESRYGPMPAAPPVVPGGQHPPPL